VTNPTEPKLFMTSTVVSPSHDGHGVPISENQPGMALLWKTGDREVRMAVKRADESRSIVAWTFKMGRYKPSGYYAKRLIVHFLIRADLAGRGCEWSGRAGIGGTSLARGLGLS
jgi:hypothetical protein